MSIRIERMKERRKKLILFFVLILLLTAGGLFIRYGCELQNIQLTGCTYYEEEAFLSWICDSKWDRQTWYSYLKLRFGEKPAIPFVEELEVDFIDLHTLHIHVYEKEIIGCLPYMGEYVCFDKDGVMVGSIVERRKDVPIITGIEYEKIVYNEIVETPQNHLFSTILNVTQLIRKYQLPVDRVAFNHDLFLTLYIEDICVLLGNREQYDEPMSALSGILKEAKGMKGTFYMENYSSENQKIIFESEEKR